MNDDDILICPYCGYEQYTHEPDEIDADTANTECEHCGCLFWYSVRVTREYSSWRDSEDELGEEGYDE